MTEPCPATVMYRGSQYRRCELDAGHDGPHQAQTLTWPREADDAASWGEE